VSINTDFSAKAPSLGYYYQIRYSLLLLLQKDNENNPFITIEGLDDITVEGVNRIDCYQTKLHIVPTTNLTDADPDFWKTIRVWASNILDKKVDINDTICSLVTTQNISDSSILTDLKVGPNRDILKIQNKLKEVAITSKNVQNKKGYQLFLKLSDSQQKSLIENITILDGSVNMSEAEGAIKKELKLTASKKNIDSLFTRLEGWWFGECITHLLGMQEKITFEELHGRIMHIVDELKSDNLPVDFPDPFSFEGEDLTLYNHFNYVKQLEIIKMGKLGVRNAISDYRRAFGQKSRWIKDSLILPDEYLEYDKRLIDYWSRRFDSMIDELESETHAEIDRSELGRTFYNENYIANAPPVNIRERFNQTYLAIGGSHMLANELKVGWHPQFKKLLAK
jgi:uncharacterized protein (DUF2164 family)